jgi:Flp pilus assembly protein TadD
VRASQSNVLGRLSEVASALLKRLPLPQQNADPEVVAALGDAALSQARIADGLSFFRRARELDPSSAAYALYLGIALKRNGDLDGARSELQQAIQLDHSLQRAYLELSAIDVQQGRISDATSVLDQYLELDPQSILVRLTRETLKPSTR